MIPATRFVRSVVVSRIHDFESGDCGLRKAMMVMRLDLEDIAFYSKSRTAM